MPEPAEQQPLQQPYPQPYQQDYYQQPYQPMPVEPKTPPPIPAAFMWLALVGIIILVVGLMVGSSSTFAEDWEDEADLRAIGNIIGEIGGLLLVLGLIVPAFATANLDPLVRAGLLISTGLLVGLLVLSVSV